MSLVDDLDQLRQTLGRSIVLPTPPACQALLDQARAAKIPVGTLFVLSRPLVPHVRGSYDRHSGDVWCYYDGGDDEGARDVLQCLLILIAYVKLNVPPATSIEEDWEHARRAHREAAALARAWGREDFFSAFDLQEFLAYDSHLYLCHVAAGVLAGSLDPSVARDAYRALLDVQQRYKWSDAQFEAALGGVSEDDEESNSVVLDFDRCALRARWLVTRTPGYAESLYPFGSFTLRQTFRTARMLRSALEQVAHHALVREASHVPVPARDHVFVRVEDEHALSQVLTYANAWLLETLPEYSAHVRWTLYADSVWRETATPSPHLYHMSVAYGDRDEDEHADERSEPIRRDLWILVPARKRDEIIEAALQRYIRSWLTCTDLCIDALYYGLQALWP